MTFGNSTTNIVGFLAGLIVIGCKKAALIAAFLFYLLS